MPFITLTLKMCKSENWELLYWMTHLCWTKFCLLLLKLVNMLLTGLGAKCNTEGPTCLQELTMLLNKLQIWARTCLILKPSLLIIKLVWLLWCRVPMYYHRFISRITLPSGLLMNISLILLIAHILKHSLSLMTMLRDDPCKYLSKLLLRLHRFKSQWLRINLEMLECMFFQKMSLVTGQLETGLSLFNWMTLLLTQSLELKSLLLKHLRVHYLTLHRVLNSLFCLLFVLLLDLLFQLWMNQVFCRWIIGNNLSTNTCVMVLKLLFHQLSCHSKPSIRLSQLRKVMRCVQLGSPRWQILSWTQMEILLRILSGKGSTCFWRVANHYKISLLLLLASPMSLFPKSLSRLFVPNNSLRMVLLLCLV